MEYPAELSPALLGGTHRLCCVLPCSGGMKVVIIEHIDCAHFLPNQPKCGTVHGHTYKIELVADGYFFSSRRRHTRSVSAFLLNRSSDLVRPVFWSCST